MTRGRIIIAATLLLAGCVPSSLSPLPEPTTPQRSNEPRIEPLMDGLIDETPIWEARPVTANAATVRQTIYVVKPGDGLRAIGEATMVGSETIARVNNLAPPYLLRPGQILRIPSGRYHRVGSGETGIAIARAYSIPWSVIVTANSLSEPFVLRVWQRLLLPGEASPTPEARAAAFKVDIDDIATGSAPAQTITGPFPDAAPTSFAGRFRWPLTGTVAERFGPVGEGRVNRGIEIAGSPGSDIRAAADGTVAFVGNGGSAGYGGLILLRHGDGWMSAYGRAAQATVARGQTVQAGQTIGSIGDEAKLHFELRRNRTAVDPSKYLPPR
jgi:murein DD-endopeptidase MepM/ murein hydrolase activator NlpD